MARVTLLFILVLVSIMSMLDLYFIGIESSVIMIFIISVLALCESIEKIGRK